MLAEVVYVLHGVYEAERKETADTLGDFIREIALPHKAAIAYAFRLYGETKLDFVDCLLAGYHFMDGDEIRTFDQKLNRMIQNT